MSSSVIAVAGRHCRTETLDDIAQRRRGRHVHALSRRGHRYDTLDWVERSDTLSRCPVWPVVVPTPLSAGRIPTGLQTHRLTVGRIAVVDRRWRAASLTLNKHVALTAWKRPSLVGIIGRRRRLHPYTSSFASDLGYRSSADVTAVIPASCIQYRTFRVI